MELTITYKDKSFATFKGVTEIKERDLDKVITVTQLTPKGGTKTTIGHYADIDKIVVSV